MKVNNNWCRLSYEIMADERITLTAAAVYGVLLDISKDNEQAETTAKKIAEEYLHQSLRSVERAIKLLKDTGYITRVERGLSNRIIYHFKSILPPKGSKTKKKTAEIAKNEEKQLEIYNTAKSEGLTPAQTARLSELIANQLDPDYRSPRIIDDILQIVCRRTIYANDKIDNLEAYLREIIISDWRELENYVI